MTRLGRILRNAVNEMTGVGTRHVSLRDLRGAKPSAYGQTRLEVRYDNPFGLADLDGICHDGVLAIATHQVDAQPGSNVVLGGLVHQGRPGNRVLTLEAGRYGSITTNGVHHVTVSHCTARSISVQPQGGHTARSLTIKQVDGLDSLDIRDPDNLNFVHLEFGPEVTSGNSLVEFLPFEIPGGHEVMLRHNGEYLWRDWRGTLDDLGRQVGQETNSIDNKVAELKKEADDLTARKCELQTRFAAALKAAAGRQRMLPNQ